jgi:diguanylate cyclase (GGDEF)-like protein/PAS domain S-box-containing protein
MSAASPPKVSARPRWWGRCIAFALATLVGLGGIGTLDRRHHAERVAEKRTAAVGTIVSLVDDLAVVHGRLGLALVAGSRMEPIVADEARVRRQLLSAVANVFPEGVATRTDALAHGIVNEVGDAADAAASAMAFARRGDAAGAIRVAATFIGADAKLDATLRREHSLLAGLGRAAEDRSASAANATLLATLALLLAIGGAWWWADRRWSRSQRAEADASARWFRALVERSGDFTAVLDAEGIVRFLAPGGGDMLGVDNEQVVDRDLARFLRSDDVGRFVPLWLDLLARPGGQMRLDAMLQHATGDLVQVEVLCTNLLDDEVVRGVVVNTRNVTTQRDLERQLVRRASRDDLTGLPNRVEFVDRLERALVAAARSGERVAVLYLDLDGFKAINDTLGHEAGDDVLVAIAHRVRAALRPSDTAGRLAGDEFTVLIDEIDDDEDALEVAARIVGAVAVPVAVAGQSIMLSVSVGLAFGDGTTSAADLLRDADTAMSEAKSSRRGSVVMFEAEMATRAWSRLRCEKDTA